MKTQSQNFLMRHAHIIVTALACAVSIDIYAGATGDADPFPLFGLPVFAALRGLVITISISYALGKVRGMLRAERRNAKALWILGVMVAVLLISETAIIAPYVLTRVLKVNMADTLWNFQANDYRVGAVMLVLWSIVVALVPTLSVAASAIATLVNDDAPMTARAPDKQGQVQDTDRTLTDKARAMSSADRLADIVAQNAARNGQGAMTSADIAARYAVSERTARRDLARLAKVV